VFRKGEDIVSFWQRILGGAARKSAPVTGFPCRRDLIPRQLAVHIYLIEDGELPGPGPCWAYVSEGLRRHGQQEVAFILRCRPGERQADFPDAPLPYFQSLYRQAEQGQRVAAGDYHKFKGFFGQNDPVGMAYIPREVLPGVDLPEDVLIAILLTGPEVAVVEQIGSYRVLTLLGQANWYFPCPPWSDRDRASVLSVRELESSVLSQTPVLYVKRVNVLMRSPQQSATPLPPRQVAELPRCSEHQHLYLHVDRAALPALQDLLARLPDQSPFALMTEPHPRGNARLVWKPGQDHIRAIRPSHSDSTQMTGGFVLFSLSPGEEGGDICEDGFLVLLSPTAWVKLRGGLLSGQSVAVAANGDRAPLTLAWNEAAYANPVDGQVVVASGGWECYHPPAGCRDTKEEGPVVWKGFIHLNLDREYRERLRNLDDMVRFMDVVDKTVREHFTAGSAAAGEDLVLECRVFPPGRAEFRLALRPCQLDGKRVDSLHEILADLETFSVRGGPVGFQMIFALWGGSGQPTLLDTQE
jgi:hypothetical protein